MTDTPIEIRLQAQMLVELQEAEATRLHGRRIGLTLGRAHESVGWAGDAQQRCDPPAGWVTTSARTHAPVEWEGRPVESIGRVDEHCADSGELLSRKWVLHVAPGPDEAGDPLSIDGWRQRQRQVADGELRAEAPVMVAFWEANMRRTLDRLL